MTPRTVFKLLCALAIVLRIALLFRGDELFYARPFIEDAYYSLSVAQSLGNGNGITVDGVHLTNGIQPLIVFLYAPFYLFFEDQLAARLCLMLCIVIECALVFLCMKFIRSAAKEKMRGNVENAWWLAATILFWSYSTTVYALNGLETALSATFVIGCALFYFKKLYAEKRSALLHSFLLGCLMGCMVLARIDTAIFVATLAGYHLFLNRTKSLGARFTETMCFGSAAVLVSSPWWWYNLSSFGHLVPTSGLSQSLSIPYQENIAALIQYLLNTFLLIGYLPYQRAIGSVHYAVLGGIASVAFSIFVIPRMRNAAKEIFLHARGSWRWHWFLPLAVYSLLLALYYLCFFGAPHFFARYLFVVHVLAVMLASMVLTHLLAYVSDRAVWLVTWGNVVFVVGMISFYGITYSWNYNPAIAKQNDFLGIAFWIREQADANEKIGMGQSGTAGYFNKHVVNLDGKVNAEVFSANRNGKYLEYIESQRFDYLIDWQKFFDDLKPSGALDEFVKIDSVGRFLIYRRKDR